VNLDMPDPQIGTDEKGNPQMTQITQIGKQSADGADVTDSKASGMAQMTAFLL
jgi:hypothetical protein